MYPLWKQCITEFLASAFLMLMGNGIISNEVLTQTKGHSIGFGFVALGFGLAVGFAQNMFSYCSAHINPAAILMGAILGRIPIQNAFPLMVAEVLGGIFGALIAFITYYPHFQLVPELESYEQMQETNLVIKSEKHKGHSALRVASHKPSLTRIGPSKDEREKVIYEATLEADRAAKLSAFSNRPAIDQPVYNFICEFICTIVLLVGVNLIEERFQIQGKPEITLAYSKGMSHLMIGFYVAMCIMCLGGPTGFSANPLRDLGPRIAHFVLPIRGKGDSEWKFALLINAASILGGVASAGIFFVLKQISVE
jgi:glycerol uptake facilitator protein